MKNTTIVSILKNQQGIVEKYGVSNLSEFGVLDAEHVKSIARESGLTNFELQGNELVAVNGSEDKYPTFIAGRLTPINANCYTVVAKAKDKANHAMYLVVGAQGDRQVCSSNYLAILCINEFITNAKVSERNGKVFVSSIKGEYPEGNPFIIETFGEYHDASDEEAYQTYLNKDKIRQQIKNQKQSAEERSNFVNESLSKNFAISLRDALMQKRPNTNPNSMLSQVSVSTFIPGCLTKIFCINTVVVPSGNEIKCKIEAILIQAKQEGNKDISKNRYVAGLVFRYKSQNINITGNANEYLNEPFYVGNDKEKYEQVSSQIVTRYNEIAQKVVNYIESQEDYAQAKDIKSAVAAAKRYANKEVISLPDGREIYGINQLQQSLIASCKTAGSSAFGIGITDISKELGLTDALDIPCTIAKSTVDSQGVVLISLEQRVVLFMEKNGTEHALYIGCQVYTQGKYFKHNYKKYKVNVSGEYASADEIGEAFIHYGSKLCKVEIQLGRNKNNTEKVKHDNKQPNKKKKGIFGMFGN